MFITTTGSTRDWIHSTLRRILTTLWRFNTAWTSSWSAWKRSLKDVRWIVTKEWSSKGLASILTKPESITTNYKYPRKGSLVLLHMTWVLLSRIFAFQATKPLLSRSTRTSWLNQELFASKRKWLVLTDHLLHREALWNLLVIECQNHSRRRKLIFIYFFV